MIIVGITTQIKEVTKILYRHLKILDLKKQVVVLRVLTLSN